MHIHNKLIFDAFNDALDFFRPFGVDGQPYTWKRQLEQSQVTVITRFNFDKVLDIAKERVLCWAESHCGVFPEKEGSTI